MAADMDKVKQGFQGVEKKRLDPPILTINENDNSFDIDAHSERFFERCEDTFGGYQFQNVGLLAQTLDAVPKPNSPTQHAIGNASLNAVQGINPQNSIEAMLASQMVTTHNLSMECARRAMAKSQYPQRMDAYLDRTAKLQNLFLRQAETLQKLRGQGQQKITVQHVQVNEGGQAVVGSVNHAAGGEG